MISSFKPCFKLFIANELDKELVARKTLPDSAKVIVGPIIEEYCVQLFKTGKTPWKDRGLIYSVNIEII